jgi:glycosyltransferase involved in cell wall biosynthesis
VDEEPVYSRDHEEKLLSQPLISVVTPFHNTAPYLAQCIESVLAQSYSNFEYLLVDNCSTDGSGEIADTYAHRDPRVRLIRRSQLLSQVQNYNRALAEISDASEYCKIVQADDFIFPDCLHLMVQAFEQSESIGLVSSYWLKGNEVRGSGFPWPTKLLAGKQMARLYLRTGLWVFGSPTAVMYRSSVVRESHPFYDESALHEDSEKCLEILKKWDFGFVHQLLSFSRADNESISSAVRDLEPNVLDGYIIVQRHASAFLEQDEAQALRKRARREYYGDLANHALRLRNAAFWRYHREGLKTLGETINWPYLAWRVAQRMLWMVANPGTTIARALRRRKRRYRGKDSSESLRPAVNE